jgi:hypothetical protein
VTKTIFRRKQILKTGPNNFGSIYAEGVTFQSPAVAGTPAHPGEQKHANSNPNGVSHVKQDPPPRMWNPGGVRMMFWNCAPRVAPRG